MTTRRRTKSLSRRTTKQAEAEMDTTGETTESIENPSGNTNRRSNRRKRNLSASASSSSGKDKHEEVLAMVDPDVVEYQNMLLDSIRVTSAEDSHAKEEEKEEQKEDEEKEEDSIASRLRKRTCRRGPSVRRKASKKSSTPTTATRKKKEKKEKKVEEEDDEEYEEEEEKEEEEEMKGREEMVLEGNPTHYISSLLRAREIGGGLFSHLVGGTPFLRQHLRPYQLSYDQPRNATRTVNRIISRVVQDGNRIPLIFEI